jgi:hypothetical protein
MPVRACIRQCALSRQAVGDGVDDRRHIGTGRHSVRSEVAAQPVLKRHVTGVPPVAEKNPVSVVVITRKSASLPLSVPEPALSSTSVSSMSNSTGWLLWETVILSGCETAAIAGRRSNSRSNILR